jgi:membrane peptidoglycan carboxypeptidase
LAKAYGGSHLTLTDYGYLLSRHPLEVWCAGQLAREPDSGWNELLEGSTAARGLVSAWLFKTRNRGAQEMRLRIQIEKEAFARMTPYWQRLGFPFERLVPTLATSIGNSSDRPAALAELMGIILNDGVKKPTLRLTQLHWGRGTPYETIMTPIPVRGEGVMAPAVARALGAVLVGWSSTEPPGGWPALFRNRMGPPSSLGARRARETTASKRSTAMAD